MSAQPDTAVEVDGLSKNYGPVVALSSVSFAIESGQYFVLLGPSGGGKTTLLRLIGGFIRPSQGRVLLHGRDVGDLPPNKRPTSMVFQSYALFPHMSVERNVAYGLKLRKVAAPEIGERVERMLELAGLTGYNARMPHELSGGQQQRVQLARSLVLESDILLLDEPLASLDAKLRKDMCLELKRIQEKVGITFIHVTHNQEEAMTIADRIAIIANGRLVEEGTARDVYERPRRRFTADFIGDNNLLDGTVAGISDGRVTVDLGYATVAVIAIDAPGSPGYQVAVGDAVSLSMRSELVELVAPGGADDGARESIPATYVEEVYLGLTTSHLVRLPDGTEVAVRRISGDQDAAPPASGQEVRVGWKTASARLHAE
ncbi:MAG: ABC transporter ATP-binding protein [Rhodospirillales bacterium]|jgi:ABC-type Fe3+/spermidine/putrescine transport system ATPase subunit|nr:ABC transporter ATP-binding protein [Rhodospirillales bacterium]HJO72988.1 ABC transporter ATP-binding protein [Rhodospirillales bacterium]